MFNRSIKTIGLVDQSNLRRVHSHVDGGTIGFLASDLVNVDDVLEPVHLYDLAQVALVMTTHHLQRIVNLPSANDTERRVLAFGCGR